MSNIKGNETITTQRKEEFFDTYMKWFSNQPVCVREIVLRHVEKRITYVNDTAKRLCKV